MSKNHKWTLRRPAGAITIHTTMTNNPVICTEWLRMRRALRSIVIALVALFPVANARAADWPMWRYDAQRSAASSERPPAELGLLWMREFEPQRQAWDDTLNLDLMTYDRVFEPIVMDGKLLVGFNDRDKLVAFEAARARNCGRSTQKDQCGFLPPAGTGMFTFAATTDSCTASTPRMAVWSGASAVCPAHSTRSETNDSHRPGPHEAVPWCATERSTSLPVFGPLWGPSSTL